MSIRGPCPSRVPQPSSILLPWLLFPLLSWTLCLQHSASTAVGGGPGIYGHPARAHQSLEVKQGAELHGRVNLARTKRRARPAGDGDMGGDRLGQGTSGEALVLGLGRTGRTHSNASMDCGACIQLHTHRHRR